MQPKVTLPKYPCVQNGLKSVKGMDAVDERDVNMARESDAQFPAPYAGA